MAIRSAAYPRLPRQVAPDGIAMVTFFGVFIGCPVGLFATAWVLDRAGVAAAPDDASSLLILMVFVAQVLTASFVIAAGFWACSLVLARLVLPRLVNRFGHLQAAVGLALGVPLLIGSGLIACGQVYAGVDRFSLLACIVLPAISAAIAGATAFALFQGKTGARFDHV